MDPVIDRLNTLHKELLSLLPMKTEYQQKLDKKFRMEFNYNSNHLEGNTLTYQETELLLVFDQSKGNHEMRELEEMKAHDVAYSLIEQWAEDKDHTITEADIRNLNQIILVKPFWKDATTSDGQATRRQIKVGVYKEQPNSVQLGNGEIFHYASPSETPIKMGELIHWFREEEEKKELPPIALAALLHYKFVLIHPFDDGNGRISRLLMNYVLLKNGLPPVIVRSADKKNYLRVLNEADTGNLNAFIEYIAEQELWSLEISIKAAKGESIDEPGDLDKKLHLLKKKLGEAETNSIQLTYSDEAVNKVLYESIQPLAKAWETRLKTFDALFSTRNTTFSSATSFTSTAALYFDKQVDKGFNDFRNIFTGDVPFGKDITEISIGTAVGLRNINNNDSSIDAGDITIRFLTDAYEINYTLSDGPINKLYHELLTKDEIALIVESLGNFLYNNIEQAIEANKQ